MLMIQCYPWKTFSRIACELCFNIKMTYYLVMLGIPLASSRPSAGGRPTLHSHRLGTGRSSAGRRAAISRLLLSFRCLPGRRAMPPMAGRPMSARPPWDVFPIPEMTPDVGEILTAQLKAPDELPMPPRCPFFSRRPAGHPTAAGRCPQKTHREDIGSSSGVNCDRSIT